MPVVDLWNFLPTKKNARHASCSGCKQSELNPGVGGGTAMTYLLGWSVIPQILVRRERWPGGYKTRGVPLVYPGQDALPDQPVIRLEKAEAIEEVATIPRRSLPAVMDVPAAANY